MALGAAMRDPSLAFDALVRSGVEAPIAALEVADRYQRLTGEIPTFDEE